LAFSPARQVINAHRKKFPWDQREARLVPWLGHSA
jgi:hypothetical protein